MPIFEALILGLVQGLTEYIPVSSTAHLILIPWLFGWSPAPFAFNILIQWGTLVGVLIYFWRDIWAIARGMINGLIKRQPLGTPEARLGWWVVVATIPAIILGLLFKKTVEQLQIHYLLIAVVIMLAGGLMWAAERWGKRNRSTDSMTAVDAGVIGLWQVLAFIPGVSRSSATISGGMLRNFTRADAARFSFLMSIPALLGAGVIALKDLFSDPAMLSTYALPLAIGFLSAAVSGYLSIRWLLGFLKRQSLTIFIAYRLVFGAVCIIVVLLGLRAASGG
jgi:undecaprenyl-diphosphatase